VAGQNEVEIVVTSKDRSGPGFDSSRRRVKEIGETADRSERKMRAFGTTSVNASGKLRASLGLASLGWAAAGVALVAGFKAVNSEATESVKTTAQTTAVIKSTGGAAHVTAGQVGDLATAISDKVGVDDEAIQTGENLLLTFTNIRNETGKGRDIFNQASRAVVDMTASLNKGEVTTDGLKASSIQLGKALNDPLKGITALQRVGVTFTAQQKEQIKTFVKHGQMAKAQGVILAEVNREFGGSAAAATTPMQKLGVTIKNLEESIGLKLLPLVNKGAVWLGAKLPAAFAALTAWVIRNKVTLQAWGLEFVLVMLKAASQFLRFVAQLATAHVAILKIFRGIYDGAFDTVIGIVHVFGKLPGPLGAPFRAAEKSVRDFRDKTDASLNDAIAKAQGFANKANSMADAVDAAARRVKNLRDAINSLHDKNVFINVTQRGTTRAFAHGGVVGAAGGGVRSNLAWVGEQGPELVRLPVGSRVYPNGAAPSGTGGGAAPTVVIQVQPGGSGLDRLFVDWLRNAVRVKGGNVQAVLGR